MSLLREDNEFISLIDKHVRAHTGFAVYRLPYTAEPKLVVDTDAGPSVLASPADLDRHAGFVLAPYDLQSGLPVVLVRPRLTAEGRSNIVECLRNIDAEPPSHIEQNLPTHNMSRSEYLSAADTFIAALRGGRVQKLVLARSAEYGMPITPGTLFARACDSYPRTMVYMFHSPLCGLWIGCSPEILVVGTHGAMQTVALAGTRHLDNANDQWTAKNIAEQHFVEQYVREALGKVADDIKADGPHTVRAANLQHLCTNFSFGTRCGAGTIAAHLHPTPAVCGLPQRQAKTIIAQTESTQRLYYSGIVGWSGAEDESRLYVNLRCLTARGNRATLFAGGGIMPDSDPEQEWNETEMKMATLLNIINQ